MTGDHEDERIYIGLATFAKGSDVLNALSSEHEGAAGWMAGRARSEDHFADLLRSGLVAVGFLRIEIEDIRELENIADARQFDEHLAYNMERWEPGKLWVWGTLYPFLAEGEA